MRKRIMFNHAIIATLCLGIPGVALSAEVKPVIEQTMLGNIFVAGKPPVIAIKSLPPGSDACFWRATDFWGGEAAKGKMVWSPGSMLKLPLQQSGFYSLEITGLSHDKPVGHPVLTSMAIIPGHKYKDGAKSPFGMGTHFGQWWPLEFIPLLQYAGIREIRDDIQWASVEKDAGTLVIPEKYTAFMREFKKLGIRPLIVLGCYNKVYENGVRPQTSESHDAFSRYALAVLREFPEIKEVEVWNEWNTEFPKNPVGDPEPYFNMQKNAYAAIKASHPDVTVMAGAVTGLWWGGYDWIKRLASLPDFAANTDALSVHPYNYWDYPGTEYLPECVAKLKDILNESGSGKPVPICVTEIGWPVNTPRRSLVLSEKLGTAKGGKRLTSDEMQALYVVRSYVQSLANGIDRCYWYDLVNDGTNASDNEHNFGLIRHPKDALGKCVPKPGYVSYAAMTRMLDGALYQRCDKEMKDALAFSFVQEGRDLMVAWTVSPAIIAISADAAMDYTDVMGAVRKGEPKAGVLAIPLAVGEPVYLPGVGKGISIGAKVVVPDIVKGIPGQDASISYTIENSLPFALPVVFKVEGKDFAVEVGAKSVKKGQLGVVVPQASDKGGPRIACQISAMGTILAESLIDIKNP